MIAGVGIDTVDIGSFREQLADRASCFAEGTFTPAELRDANARPGGDPTRHLAARFAAKEALVKAWSASRFGSPPALRSVDMLEIEVISDGFGRPAIRLHGRVAADLARTGPYRTHVSLSHDGDSSIAVVVLEATGETTP